MIDRLDYEEPVCPLAGGRAFYAPDDTTPLGHIPVSRVIEKLDRLFHRNQYPEAGRLLLYWRDEAIALRDRRGELAMVNELVGFYRKQNETESALSMIERALFLVEALGQNSLASGATIYINCATAYVAFEMLEEALPLYHRAEEIYRATLSPTDERFGALYNNMALALAGIARYEEAERAYTAALAVVEQLPGREADAAITYVNLAYLYEGMGRMSEAAACMKRARTWLTSERLVHDGYYAFVLEKCAPAFAHFGEEALAEEMIQEARTIYAGT